MVCLGGVVILALFAFRKNGPAPRQAIASRAPSLPGADSLTDANPRGTDLSPASRRIEAAGPKANEVYVYSYRGGALAGAMVWECQPGTILAPFVDRRSLGLLGVTSRNGVLSDFAPPEMGVKLYVSCPGYLPGLATWAGGRCQVRLDASCFIQAAAVDQFNCDRKVAVIISEQGAGVSAKQVLSSPDTTLTGVGPGRAVFMSLPEEHGVAVPKIWASLSIRVVRENYLFGRKIIIDGESRSYLDRLTVPAARSREIEFHFLVPHVALAVVSGDPGFCRDRFRRGLGSLKKQLFQGAAISAFLYRLRMRALGTHQDRLLAFAMFRSKHVAEKACAELGGTLSSGNRRTWRVPFKEFRGNVEGGELIEVQSPSSVGKIKIQSVLGPEGKPVPRRFLMAMEELGGFRVFCPSNPEISRGLKVGEQIAMPVGRYRIASKHRALTKAVREMPLIDLGSTSDLSVVVRLSSSWNLGVLRLVLSDELRRDFRYGRQLLSPKFESRYVPVGKAFGSGELRSYLVPSGKYELNIIGVRPELRMTTSVVVGEFNVKTVEMSADMLRSRDG